MNYIKIKYCSPEKGTRRVQKQAKRLEEYYCHSYSWQMACQHAEYTESPTIRGNP